MQKISKNDVVLPPRKACQSNRIWMTITFFLICFSSFLLCFIQIQMTGRIIIGQIKQCLILYFSKWINLEPKMHIKNTVSFWIWLPKVYLMLYADLILIRWLWFQMNNELIIFFVPYVFWNNSICALSYKFNGIELSKNIVIRWKVWPFGGSHLYFIITSSLR